MKTFLFDYALPEKLIAQKPVRPRDHSRLMVIDHKTGRIKDRIFRDLGEYLKPGDLLVLNDTKVFRARLFGNLATGGKVEIFLLRPICSSGRSSLWQALGKPAKKLKPGTIVSGRGFRAVIAARGQQGICEIKFNLSRPGVFRLASREGHIPVPPYIKFEPKQEDVYQTVYAKKIGSVAAPTAGFHFTRRLIAALRRRGIKFATVTLHVGVGTFRSIESENIGSHQMHAEYAVLPLRTQKMIAQTKKQGGRVIAVGTTTVRALEGLAHGHPVSGRAGWVNIFIKPGYKFTVIDGLITNFHLPRSTLIVLVSTLAGRQFVLSAYRRAVRKRYRFYSFGDAMLVL
jgi:S-adenosylmethionine:tRNA ribosyltransferase-isomerase